MEQFLYWAGAIIATGGALAVIWRAVIAGRTANRKMDIFLEDWFGSEARPGRPAVPGVMQRFVDQDTRLAALEGGVADIRHEVYPNSGGSLRDAVDALGRRLALVESALQGVPSVPTQRQPDWPPTGRVE